MDPSAKGNVLMFLGAMLVIATFWLVLLGVTSGEIVKVALGVVAGALAVWVFRLYAATLRDR